VSGRREYEVTWTMIYDADSPEDAVRQALAALDGMSSRPSEGPNVFVVMAPGVIRYVSAKDALERRDDPEG